MLEFHNSFMYVFAGIAMFMFGMTLVSDSLQKLTSNNVQRLLDKLSDRPFFGFFVGILLTLFMQSSGAVTSMIVGLATAGVVTLSQVMSVIMGAAVGATFVVQLLSLNITQYGLAIFSFSFLVYFLTSKKKLKLIVSVAMGFGLIFWGLEFIGIGTSSLKDMSLFSDFISILKENPLVTILATAFFTAIVHSSAVTIGFAIGLAGSGLITLTDALYWVYGANIGTTATALIASLGGNYMGRRVAWGHCFFKVAGVLVFYSFTPYFVNLMTGESLSRDIANSHTVFNILAAALFFFFIPLIVKLIEKLIPPPSREKEFSVKYLKTSDKKNPTVALAHGEREVMRMGDIVVSMIEDALKVFDTRDLDLEEEISKRDDRLDLLNHEINLFVADCMDESDGDHKERLMRIMTVATDLESVGDIIDKSLLDMARKKHVMKLSFSTEAREDLRVIHKKVLATSKLSMTCFQLQDKDLALKVIQQKRKIRDLEKSLRHSHMERLVARKKHSISTSSIYLDILSDLRRIVGLMSKQVYNLTE